MAGRPWASHARAPALPASHRQEFQNPADLTYFEREHYRFKMLPPFFNPGPIDHPHVPLYVAAVNPYVALRSGQLCDGLRLHPISTFRYTREVVLSAIDAGLARSGRALMDFDLVGAPFMALERNTEEVNKAMTKLRNQLAFYASTRTYHGVPAHHAGRRPVRSFISSRLPASGPTYPPLSPTKCWRSGPSSGRMTAWPTRYVPKPTGSTGQTRLSSSTKRAGTPTGRASPLNDYTSPDPRNDLSTESCL